MGNYNYSEGDPKEIKKILEGSKVKCNVSLDDYPSLTIGDSHEINIVNAFFEHDWVGIWWELDIIHFDDMYEEVVVTDVKLITDFLLQIEGQETVKRLKGEYLISDEEVDAAMKEMTIHSLIESLEEKYDRLDNKKSSGAELTPQEIKEMEDISIRIKKLHENLDKMD
jgi:hypothetical protein